MWLSGKYAHDTMKHGKKLKVGSAIYFPANRELKDLLDAAARFECTTRSTIIRQILMQHYRALGHNVGKAAMGA